jgi:hypothetical protein
MNECDRRNDVRNFNLGHVGIKVYSMQPVQSTLTEKLRQSKMSFYYLAANKIPRWKRVSKNQKFELPLWGQKNSEALQRQRLPSF